MLRLEYVTRCDICYSVIQPVRTANKWVDELKVIYRKGAGENAISITKCYGHVCERCLNNEIKPLMDEVTKRLEVTAEIKKGDKTHEQSRGNVHRSPIF